VKNKQSTLSRITDDRSPIANHRSLLTAEGYPVDPMNKMPDKKEETRPDRNRRRFLTKLWIGLGIVAIGECIAVIITFLRPVKTGAKSGESSTIIEAGPVASFPPHSVTAFVRGKFYLCRLKDGGFLAVSRKCTHLGCTVPWVDTEKRFVCPCHGSAFDISGEVLSPPAPRALDIYGLFIENNIVKVDTGRRVKRSVFRADQVVHP
jgi:cytochrome b6-f complex iron-sulfur subunit